MLRNDKIGLCICNIRRFRRPWEVFLTHLITKWGLPVGPITQLRDTPIFKLFYLSRYDVEILYAYYSYKMEYNDMHICGVPSLMAAMRPSSGAEGPTFLFIKINKKVGPSAPRKGRIAARRAG